MVVNRQGLQRVLSTLEVWHQSPKSLDSLEDGGAQPSPRPWARLAPLLAWCPVRLRAWVLAVLAILAVRLAVAGAAAAGPALYRVGQNTWRHAYYSSDPTFFGRNDGTFPAPHCCVGAECAARSSRTAVLSYLLSDSYLPLLKQLHCTLRRSNPGAQLVVMTASDRPLGEEAVRWLQEKRLARVEVAPLSFPNYFNPSYGANFVKVRALNLTQYDAVLLVDSDVVVLGDISPLFSLPVDFAASWDQNKWLGRFNTRLPGGINGGVMFLRPCPAVAEHMVELLEANPQLRFSYGAAEQDFFNWYYRYSGMMLPLEYNTMASDSLRGDATIGGRPPVMVHFTQNKPFMGAVKGKPGHQFLCSPEELGD